MSKAVSDINRIAPQAMPSKAAHQQVTDCGNDRDETVEESRLRTPEEFFEEVTRRSDIDEILKRLANI